MRIDDYEVYFFDLDGLLINTEPLFYQACLETWNRYQIPITLSFNQYYSLAMLGREKFQKSFIELFPQTQTFFPDYFLDRDRYYQDLLLSEHVQLMPGVETLLPLLEGKRLGVVTNSSKESTLPVRAAHPILECMQFWITREDYTNPKPDSDSYQLAWKRFVREGDRVIGFEDSLKGLQALSGVPSTMVAVNAAFSLEETKSLFPGRECYYFSSLEELCSCLQNQ
ncbi:HAD family phosphatase [Chlamydia muridarum str. Nigg]|uniref:phosphoglycolate phosphatase n=2 Tax=Chlamydia muridarum TaxID=83560 RepID=A0A069ZV87_CHLMR|nr:HAD family phosphatase [Chlamydia muridarum]UFW21302.1 HAD family phosphatase [Chlamydia trachomatis]AAF73601.1 hydrolase, haloacid dehalogenase-like family [Chlamydia muridarum str. Nigg]AHH23135.1 HAD family hydrolase [Chlamydia muridarum str. Nigg3 CMUT3-5]AHH24060.1 HAD family hydrolase [Chlamydia muridarum str. Nigg CM972]AID38264.1 HAD family hydrolase [Chlamydia muridarum str. Nigg 2 MCR]